MLYMLSAYIEDLNVQVILKGACHTVYCMENLGVPANLWKNQFVDQTSFPSFTSPKESVVRTESTKALLIDLKVRPSSFSTCSGKPSA